MVSRASLSSHPTAISRAARRRVSRHAILLATSALVSLALPTMAAHAVDGIWSPAAPATPADFNDATNWSGTGSPPKAPNGAADTATFNTNATNSIQFTADTALGALTLNPNANYTFDTNGKAIDVEGVGISIRNGASMTLNVNGTKDVTFENSSTADQATINVSTGSTSLRFADSSKAGQAQITVSNGSGVLFFTSSNAESASITADGSGSTIQFDTGASGGTAKINLTHGGALDITSIDASTTIGSLKDDGTGQVFLGSKNLAVGGDNTSTTFGGVIQDGGQISDTGGSLTKEGTGILTLTGINTYTGATTITGGVLALAGSGSIASSNGVSISGGGAFDISAISGGSTTIASLAGDATGNVFLGSRTLVVGNSQSTSFAGVIQDGSAPGAGGPGDGQGSLSLAGGTLTLTGTSTYTGATNVNVGTLIVDGSIAKSSGVEIQANGTLGGTGFVPSVFVAGTLAPGDGPGKTGTLNVQGDLTFISGSTYLVQVSPSAAASTAVTGKATLGGATVSANFAPGSYITSKYTILTAGSINGNFASSVVTSNLSPLFQTTLSQDNKDVFLNLSGSGTNGSGGNGRLAAFNTNQLNVGNAMVNSLSTAGGMPGAFGLLSPTGLSQISGETAVGTQQATFSAMNQFMGVLLDPTVGALSGAHASDAFASMARKAPAEAFESRWGVWGAVFGGSQNTSGNAVVGSNNTASNIFGTAVGADYRFSPNTIAGFALAGGGTHFTVDNGGSGNSDLFQAGAYVRHTQGAVFLAAALAYGWQDVTTNRTVTAFGIDSLRAEFKTNALSGRLEGGYKVATGVGDITPYAAGQFTTYRLPSYAEQTAFGTNTFALNYAGKDVTASRTELGLRGETAVTLTDATLMLRGRLAWAHDFNTDRNVQATFQALPGSAFVVNGATPAADTALTTISAETLWRNGWSASITGDAQLSDSTHSYSGKGVVRYSW